MTSFLIAYPDIPSAALTTTPSVAFETDYSFENLCYGKRSNYARLASNGTSFNIVWDLGAGNSRTVDHFIVCGGYRLFSNTVNNVVLAGSPDGSSWTNQLGSTTGFSTATRSGPDSVDLVFTAAFNDTIAGSLTAYRYWRASFSSVASHKFDMSKIFCGAFFDAGQEPAFFNVEVLHEDIDSWRYPRGQILMTKSKHPYHRVTVEWDNLSDAKAAEFTAKILKRPPRDTFVLYTATHHDPLFSFRSLHCKVVADECSVTKLDDDYNAVIAVFEEDANG